MKDNHILLSISMLISGKEEMEKSLRSLLYFKEAIPCEIILVDTGCNEKQRALAEQYADAVYDFVWCNDFAAARNVGLQAARGEWFLYLDDDEWFENPREIIEFFRSGEHKNYKCASYVVRNYANFEGTIYEDSYPSRMVKREPYTKFIGKIHEYLDPFELPKKEFFDYVHHYGYVFKNDEDKEKHNKRNLPLLLEMCKEHPGDPRWTCQLAQEYFAVRDFEETIKVSIDGINTWFAMSKHIKYSPSHVGALYAYILISLESLKRFGEEEKWLEKAFSNPLMRMKIMEPTEAFYCLVAARLYSLTENYAKCREYFKRYLHYYKELKDNRVMLEDGTAGVTTMVFQDYHYNAVILMSTESLIRMEDYELAREAFFGVDWSDVKMLRQHKWEKKMLDACCSVAYHPLWKEILQTLVTRQGGAEEMYEVLLDLEDTYEEEPQQEKLLCLRGLMESLEGEKWQEICQAHYRKRDEEEYAENWTMDLELAYGILEILQTVWDAVKQMSGAYADKDIAAFNALSMDAWEALTTVQNLALRQIPNGSRIRLSDGCACAMESLMDIKMLVLTQPENVEWRLEYELAPIVEAMALQFYYWGIVEKHPEEMDEFLNFMLNSEIYGLLQLSEEERQYEYDLTIAVAAYDGQEYTKKCIKSILDTLPEDIKCEVILLNYGTLDEAKAVLEEYKEVKLINTAGSGILPHVGMKAFARGRYYLQVDHNAIMGENSMANLYRCALNHKDYGYIAPANQQTFAAQYNSQEGFEEFAKVNNVYEEARHEECSILYNPVYLMPMDVLVQSAYDTYEIMYCNKKKRGIMDDVDSLWMQNNGYKCMLAKDAYCHYFDRAGEVTLKFPLNVSKDS